MSDVLHACTVNSVGVDAVGARRNDRDLRAALAAAAGGTPARPGTNRIRTRRAEDAAARQRLAVARLDDADLCPAPIVMNFCRVDDVLPRPEPEVETRRERVGLERPLRR